MLIFDHFFRRPDAESFAQACRVLGKSAFVWPSQDAMHEAFNSGYEVGVVTGASSFPFVLEGTVVTVERDDEGDVEGAFEKLVVGFGGRFAGT